MKFDIIIIGGGLGGLTAGAKLSKEGKKVLLIEQHDRPGGCATNFRRNDFTMEVGLHELHGPGPGDLKLKIFQELGVFGNVEFLRVPEFYRFINGRSDVTILHDPQAVIERLSGLYPEESEGIKGYFDQLLKPRKRNPEGRAPDMSVGAFLDSIIKNDELKLVLLGNLGYYHDNPYDLSLAYYSQAQGNYYLSGATFIRGGSQKLSDYLAGFIRLNGGEVILNHLVTKIFAENGRLTGVSYRKRPGEHAENMTATGDEIIAAGSLPGLADLLPPEMTPGLRNELKGQKAGPSLLTLYLGFRKPLKELGWQYYSVFVYDKSVRTLSDICPNHHSDFGERSFTFVDYGQVDSCLAPAGKGVGAICCIDYVKDWEGLSQEEYKIKKEIVAQTLMDRLQAIVPGIKDSIEYYEVATASTVRRYTLNSEGSVYGFAQTPSRKMIDNSLLPCNLHIASAWGRTGGGFSGAIFGGYLCAMNIIRNKSHAGKT